MAGLVSAPWPFCVPLLPNFVRYEIESRLVLTDARLVPQTADRLSYSANAGSDLTAVRKC